MTAPLTLLLPVYGRSSLLAEAWQSLQHQSDPDWLLLLADDGSDAETASWIAAEPERDLRTTWIRRDRNLGLFANLNAALNDYPWQEVMLLCSDDRLLPHAVAQAKQMRSCWPQVGLIISSHLSIDANGMPLADVCGWHHNRVATTTTSFTSKQSLPLLLQYGSLNGNLTGMQFCRELWQAAGPFRADWRHAADWEWLMRAAEQAPLLLNREPLAEVRSHNDQLSNANRRGGEELREVAAVQQLLLAHPLLAHEPRRWRWAAHRLQFQLWNLLKQLAAFRWRGVGPGLGQIHQSVGLGRTFIALLVSLPERLQRRFI
jgi:glycosyltransferase involved in cell wall biosynthesis